MYGNNKNNCYPNKQYKIVVNNGDISSGNYNYLKNIWQNNKNMI